MSLTREQIDAWKEQLRLEGQQCTSYTDGVLAALVFVILGVPGIKIADLADFEGPDLWKLAVTAHHNRPHIIGLVKVIYGDAMFRCLYAITYPLAPRMAA